MNKKCTICQTLAFGKAVYVKPTAQVHELEMEGAILSGSPVNAESYPPSMDFEEEEWS